MLIVGDFSNNSSTSLIILNLRSFGAGGYKNKPFYYYCYYYYSFEFAESVLIFFEVSEEVFSSVCNDGIVGYNKDD